MHSTLAARLLKHGVQFKNPIGVSTINQFCLFYVGKGSISIDSADHASSWKMVNSPTVQAIPPTNLYVGVTKKGAEARGAPMRTPRHPRS